MTNTELEIMLDAATYLRSTQPTATERHRYSCGLVDGCGGGHWRDSRQVG